MATTNMKDPYDMLGIPRGASELEVKTAYRKLAKELHPDLNPGDSIVEQRFKEVTAAYNLLSNKEKRAQFDRGEIDAAGNPSGDFGFRRGGMGGGFGGGNGGFGGFGGGNAEDIFSDLFGRNRGPRKPVRVKGKDVNYTISVSFIDSVLGTKRRMKLFDGKSVELNIPPGTEDGQSLRLKNKGTPGMGGGSAGDAFVEIHVAKHAYFERDGKDIFLDVPITLAEAVQGGKIPVPTIHGAVSVTVPTGANTGTTLRLKRKGIPDTKGGQGDQYVKLKVMLPEIPDKDLVEFIKEWSKDYDYDVRKKAGFDKI